MSYLKMENYINHPDPDINDILVHKDYKEVYGLDGLWKKIDNKWVLVEPATSFSDTFDRHTFIEEFCSMKNGKCYYGTGFIEFID
jgi:hypothetical protein